ncbi:hypothetical protein [Serratia fonticola]
MSMFKDDFREKATKLSQLETIEAKCDYVNELLEDILTIEDGWVTYDEESDSYLFFAWGGHCSMRIVMDCLGGVGYFEIECR